VANISLFAEEDLFLCPGQEKTAAVRKFSVPKNVRAVQEFLGLTEHFRKFLLNYSPIALPLTDLRKYVCFRMAEPQLNAFQSLKDALTKEHVLKLYRRGAKTELHTGASKDGFAAVLMQWFDGRRHPVQY